MREIARKAAKMEKSVFVLIEKPDGTYYFVKDGEDYAGTFSSDSTSVSVITHSACLLNQTSIS